jgi:hypothetical protein
LTNPLAIASVTAVLKDVLENGIIPTAGSKGIGDVSITAMPPDRLAAGPDERSQLNLFLYRVAPFSGLRPAAQTEPEAGENPLVLELWYLLTACGAEDLHSEILLGSAMHVLHDSPVLSPERIRAALGPAGSKGKKHQSSPALAALSASRLAEQVQRINIKPKFLSFDEMSKIWSAVQGRYRPSMAYEVSAVVIGGGRARAAVAA